MTTIFQSISKLTDPVKCCSEFQQLRQNLAISLSFEFASESTKTTKKKHLQHAVVLHINKKVYADGVPPPSNPILTYRIASII